MNARILRPDEWGKLNAASLDLAGTVRPDCVAPVVVERDGEIVAAVLVLRIPHFEGLWIKPEHRGNAGVFRALIRLAYAVARQWSKGWVYAGATDDRMSGILPRLRGKKVEMDTWIVPVNGR